MGMEIYIGIDKKDRKAIADGLSHLLADTYVLYLKTHNYHWNVTGPMFQTLHLMFQVQYNELWLAVDLVAERIRPRAKRARTGVDVPVLGLSAARPGRKDRASLCHYAGAHRRSLERP